MTYFILLMIFLRREAMPWRRSTSRDISSNFDSMFPSHPTFPRGENVDIFEI